MLTALPRALVAATTLALLATGCSSEDPVEPPEPTAAPSDFLGETVAPDAEDGLPADYPRDVAPLALGQSTTAEAGVADGFSVLTTFSDADNATVLDEALSTLGDAGWEVTARPDDADEDQLSATLSLGTDGLVIIQSVQSEEDVSISYFVQPPAG